MHTSKRSSSERTAAGAQDVPPRVVIEAVAPEVDCGRFPIKRTLGEYVRVEADIFVEGHDEVSALLLYRPEDDQSWAEIQMERVADDRWRAEFRVESLGRYHYTVEGWVDRFKTWRRDLLKKSMAGQEVAAELLEGAALVEAAAGLAGSVDSQRLRAWAARLRDAGAGAAARVEEGLDDGLADLMASHPDRSSATRYGRELAVVVDREKARYSTWYEMFPRSAGAEEGRHGTFLDVVRRLPYVASMGFDVLYLPPIHPIGRSFRKGRNNSPVCEPDDPGSPWGIGAEEGGHTAIHPQLGTLEDFRYLVSEAARHGMEVALDIAFQCSPDHPWVREHPEWFRWRPDGTVQYAENPPKKYQDIYPLNFENPDWRNLWEELKGVVLYWAEQGIRIFRVDNPHTKPFAFWEWLIGEVKRAYPDAIFLSEAFTRPKVMYRLAKLGFTQSYTYFAWRSTKQELEQYFTEITQSDVCEYFRPSLWPNTPDILTEQLQYGGRPAFIARLVLAATLGASYGIYGPPFELQESRAREPGSEEYLDSEKYQTRHWDLDSPSSLRELIARVNRIRRENPALQTDRTLRFHHVDSDRLICYSKRCDDPSNLIVVVVNLDEHWKHSGWIELPLEELGLEPDRPYQMRDLLSDAHFIWHGSRNYVELDPRVVPAHIFRVRRRVRSEHQFEYFA